MSRATATQTLNGPHPVGPLMARVVVAALLLVSAGLAGCLGEEQDAQVDPTNATGSSSGSGPSDPSTTAGADADRTASEQNASGPVESPQLEPGDWWRYRVEHSLADEPITVTLAVAEATRDSYRLGWVEAEPALPTLLFHLPPVGELSRPDLGSWWHDDEVRILDFPLVDGKTWSGSLGDTQLTYTASRDGAHAGGALFTVEGADGNGTVHLRAEYSQALGFYRTIERFFPGNDEASPGVYLEDSGDAASLDGPIQVPSMEDLANAAMVGPDPMEQRPPVGDPYGTFTVENGTSWLVLGGFLGGAEGHYEVEWRQPTSGPIIMATTNSPGASSMGFVHAELADAEGQWSYRLAAAGPGFVFAEAIGVTLDEVPLDDPSGG